MDATSNANLVGQDEYPTTISAATTLLRGYTNDNAGKQQSGATNDGINFAIDGAESVEQDGNALATTGQCRPPKDKSQHVCNR
jgi:hypothetical protein